MEKIIVIRATDPDGSVFKAIMDALNGKKGRGGRCYQYVHLRAAHRGTGDPS